MKTLVTGGGGFIGSHLVRVLVQRGDQVRVLDNGFSGSPARLADVAESVEWLDGDIRDALAVQRACQGVEVVFHQAALASVPQSVADPITADAVNVGGTLQVLQAARAAGARRVVFASSCAIYGDDPVLPKTETLAPRPQSPYAVQKLAAETYCRLWPALYGMEAVALRYFNVYGPGQDPRGTYAAVIPRFIDAIVTERRPKINGDGEQSRDFVFVGDIVRANLLAAEAPGAVGAVVNIGTGSQISLNQLIALLSNISGREVQPEYGPAQPGDVRASVAATEAAQSLLGFVPATTFSDGLRQTYAWFAGNQRQGTR